MNYADFVHILKWPLKNIWLNFNAWMHFNFVKLGICTMKVRNLKNFAGLVHTLKWTSKYLCCFHAFIFYWIYNKSSHFQINKWTMQIFFTHIDMNFGIPLLTFYALILIHFVCAVLICITKGKLLTSCQRLRPIGHHHFFLLYELLYLFYMYTYF